MTAGTKTDFVEDTDELNQFFLDMERMPEAQPHPKQHNNMPVAASSSAAPPMAAAMVSHAERLRKLEKYDELSKAEFRFPHIFASQ